MKLNPDCIRDILLTVEDNCTINNGIRLPDNNFEKLNKYTIDELMYHVRQCALSEFFYRVIEISDGSYFVTDLSPQGHEFLADIRKDNNWNKVKEVSSKVGSNSLKAIMQIASSVVADLIKQYI